jgi:chromosome segregation ATPase
VDLATFRLVNEELEPLRHVLGMLLRGEELAQELVRVQDEMASVQRQMDEHRERLGEIELALVAAKERSAATLRGLDVEVAEARDKADREIARVEREAILAQRTLNEQLQAAEAQHAKVLQRLREEQSDAEEDVRKARERMGRILDAARLRGMHE